MTRKYYLRIPRWRFNGQYDPYVTRGAGFDFYGPAMKSVPQGTLDGVTGPTPIALAAGRRLGRVETGPDPHPGRNRGPVSSAARSHLRAVVRRERVHQQGHSRRRLSDLPADRLQEMRGEGLQSRRAFRISEQDAAGACPWQAASRAGATWRNEAARRVLMPAMLVVMLTALTACGAAS